MKKYLWLISFFTIIGCVSINFDPVTHPEQRIQFEGFNFLPPNGKNWEMTTDPLEVNLTWKEWGRGTLKKKAFKKSIVGPNQKPDEAEILKASVNKYEFGIFKFDHEEDLMEISQGGIKTMDQRALKLLESTVSHEKISGMNCVRNKGKAEGGRRLPEFEVLALTHYFQQYICVHPRYSNHLIELSVEQIVLKGHTPTNAQSELDHFLNSLQAH